MPSLEGKVSLKAYLETGGIKIVGVVGFESTMLGDL